RFDDDDTLDYPNENSKESSHWENDKILLNTFKVKGILGFGGSGTVYKIERTIDNRLFAVKTLLPESSGSIRKQRLFFNELRNWLNLPEHPNLVTCRFFKTIDNKLAIFADYIDGNSLKTLIKSQKIHSLAQILDIAIQIAFGLQAAHRHGLIHFDIKPSNILVSHDGEVKITDFGISVLHSIDHHEYGDLDRIKSGSSEGMTLAYCSPEQVEGRSLDQRTDIWSYGLTLLEMFTHAQPLRFGFLARDYLEAILKERQNFQKIEIPDPITSILRGCLETDLMKRWDSMNTIIDSLQIAHRNLISTSYPRSTPDIRPPRPYTYIEITRRTPVGRFWDNPQKWLMVVDKISNDKMPDNDRNINQFRSFKDQAITDLELYDVASRKLLKLPLQRKVEFSDDIFGVLINKASVHEYISDFSGAKSTYETAAAFFEKPEIYSINSRSAEYLTEISLRHALLLTQSGMYQEALNMFEKSEIWLEKQTSVSLDDLAIERMKIKANQGIVLSRLGSQKKAMAIFSEIITYLEEEVLNQNRSDVSDYLNQIYVNWVASARNSEYQQQLPLILDRSIVTIETIVYKHHRYDQINYLADLYYNRGIVSNDDGFHTEAQQWFDKSIAIYENLVEKEYLTEYLPDLARTYTAKAGALMFAKQLEDALTLNEKALEIFSELVDFQGRQELLDELAATCVTTGITALNLNRSEESIALLRKAEKLFKQLHEAFDRNDTLQKLAKTYDYLAINFRNMKDYRQAISMYESAEKIYTDLFERQQNSRFKDDYVKTIARRAEVFLEMGDISSASMTARKAHELLSELIVKDPRPDIYLFMNWFTSRFRSVLRDV
ncbi:serine/threonine protein kinase, partial [bacterium]|nr:serine/threonine protein kinase [candidate division CSSED10-310 bacterium]